MGIFKNYLLVSDVDGTLLENGVIPQRNIEAIDYFIKESGKFSICSGRSIEAVRPIHKHSHSNAPCVVFNGANVFDYGLDKIVCETANIACSIQVVKDVSDYEACKCSEGAVADFIEYIAKNIRI